MSALLVLLETDGAEILESSLSSIKFAQDLAARWQTDFDLLAIGGPDIAGQAEAWLGYGAAKLWCVAQPELAHPTADRIASVCKPFTANNGATTLVGVSTTFGKDVLPQVAEMQNAPMLSDVIALGTDAAGLQFVRPTFAGNVLATVEIASRSSVISVRAAAFRNPDKSNAVTPIKQVTVDSTELPTGTEWISLHAAARERPELTAARVVVSGGRPLKDAPTFERIMGGLADALHGAVGATRAAVDSGIAPNELQVGQTGKVVAPDLYIAAGVSGSVQHLAGMKDSKVIVAINTDPSAPIFDVADYGLVADLFDAVPELTEAVKATT